MCNRILLLVILLFFKIHLILQMRSFTESQYMKEIKNEAWVTAAHLFFLTPHKLLQQILETPLQNP